MLHNFLSRPLSFLGWTTAMLVRLDFRQTQSNLYKWFRMWRHDWSSTSQKEHMLHLSLSPCTAYQLQLVSSSRHWCLHIEQPQAQHPPTSTHYYKSTSPPEVWDLLVSDASWYHHREAQNHSPEHSRSPFLAGGMISPPIRHAGSLSIFKQQLKTHLSTLLDLIIKKIKNKNICLYLHLSLYLYLIPLLACIYLNNA